jgi:putative oxidoreductase
MSDRGLTDVTLILGIWARFVALAAAGLLLLFGTAMAISFGLKSPLDYSVFSASAGALLLPYASFERQEITYERV